MTTKARIAVIGSGWWATEAHIPAIREHPEADLVAICDRDPVRLGTAANAYGVERTYLDYHEMLAAEDLDGIVIATPHATHYSITRDCLNHGLHVLLEKPMTLFAREARDLVELADSQQKQLIIGYPYNFMPHAIRARETILSGELGAVQYVNCTFASNVLRFLDGSVAPDRAPTRYRVQGPSTAYNDPNLLGGGEGHLQITHIAGLMFFVTGLQIAQVNALMANYGLATDVVDVMAIAFRGGALGLVGGTGNANANYKMSVTVYCERGRLDADSGFRLASLKRADGSEIALEEPKGGNLRNATTHNLIDVALGRAENGSPAEVGWRTVELLDAAYRSAAAQGRGVTAEDLYAEGPA